MFFLSIKQPASSQADLEFYQEALWIPYHSGKDAKHSGTLVMSLAAQIYTLSRLL